jgi:hypothetical protein
VGGVPEEPAAGRVSGEKKELLENPRLSPPNMIETCPHLEKTMLLRAIIGIGLIGVLSVDSVGREEPKIVFDNRPEAGIPLEAKAQADRKLTAREKELAAKAKGIKFHTFTAGTIKLVRIRYFNKETWKSEKEASEYLAGVLANKSSGVFGFQIWSQGVGVPEIECLVEFTDEHCKKLLAENEACQEGRLLIWHTEACFRDATGRWYYVNIFDQFHRGHPKGDRRLVK